MQYEWVEIDNLRLHVGRSLQLSNQPVLLILSGFGAPLESSLPLIDALNDTAVLCVDIPGIGRSLRSAKPMRLGALSNLLAQLLDHYQLEQVDLLGISWGGALAQQFCRSHPDRVRKLILAATSTGALMVPGHPIDLVRLWLPSATATPSPTISTRSPLPPGTPQIDVLGMLYQLYALSGWTSLHWLHQIQHPCLVLSGRHDRLVPRINGAILAARLPNAIHQEFEGGHWFILQQSADVAFEIEKFLNQKSCFNG